MFVLKKMGEHSCHGADFSVDRPRGYDCALILFVHTPAEFFLEGRWRTIPPDTAIVFRPGQPHRYRATGEIYADSWIRAELPKTLMQGDFPFGSPIPLHNAPGYHSLLQLMNREFYSASPQREEIVHYLGMALIHMLAGETLQGGKPPIYDQLVSLRRALYTHPELEWSVDAIAGELAVSPGHLEKLYRRYFGTTINRELIQSRIDSACALLSATTMSVERIAECCGYHNTEHFIRQFKAVTGMPPGQYRRNLSPEERAAQQNSEA